MEILSTFIRIGLCLSTFFSYLTPKKQERKQRQKAKLPPGSMGWPYIGETLQLYSQDPNHFFSTKQSRYGNIFKTHMLGCPCVMMASPEAAKYVLATHAHLFKPTYPKSKETLIGTSALFFHQGDYHTHLRKLVQKAVSPETIKKLVPEIESIALSTLESWSHGKIINTFNEMKKFSLEVAILSVFGHLDRKHKEELKENYCILNRGYNSFPTNLPGTAYSKAISARKRLGEIVSEIICERKETKLLQKDLLGQLLNFKDEKGQTFTEDQIADNIIGVLFAAQDTTASALTWILKYLHDNRKLLEPVKEEHNAIYENNNGGQRSFTWAQTRTMLLTHRVILESLRMSSIVSYTYREAVVDVEYEGFLIPKGWKVMPLFRNIHHNPAFFVDPENLHPSRFEVPPKPNTFVPFGIGAHACPGNELAKLQMLILLHHLVTKFRWEVAGSNSGTEYSPFPIPHEGLPAKFSKPPDLSKK